MEEAVAAAMEAMEVMAAVMAVEATGAASAEAMAAEGMAVEAVVATAEVEMAAVAMVVAEKVVARSIRTSARCQHQSRPSCQGRCRLALGCDSRGPAPCHQAQSSAPQSWKRTCRRHSMAPR